MDCVKAEPAQMGPVLKKAIQEILKRAKSSLEAKKERLITVQRKNAELRNNQLPLLKKGRKASNTSLLPSVVDMEMYISTLAIKIKGDKELLCERIETHSTELEQGRYGIEFRDFDNENAILSHHEIANKRKIIDEEISQHQSRVVRLLEQHKVHLSKFESQYKQITEQTSSVKPFPAEQRISADNLKKQLSQRSHKRQIGKFRAPLDCQRIESLNLEIAFIEKHLGEAKPQFCSTNDKKLN